MTDIQTTDGQMIDLWAFAFLYALMLLGAVWHWWKKKRRGELRGNLVSYLLSDHPGSSALSGGSILGAAAIAAMTGAADFIDPRLLWEQIVQTGKIAPVQGWLLYASISGGWMLDSWLNKGGKP